MREFCNIIRTLNINFENPEEIALVDELVDQAQALKLPCFEYIYFVIAGRFGVSTMKRDIIYPPRCPEQFSENKYYLFRDCWGLWQLYYDDSEKNRHQINIAEVSGLEAFLNELPLDAKIMDHNRKISFLLNRFEGLRPLGFFKSVQQAVTEFTASSSFEEAMSCAQALEALKLRYKEHFGDKLKYAYKIREGQSSTSERFFGTELGKKIKWMGFDFSTDEVPYTPFLAWAKQDASGIIASTLFRLGLSNHSDVLNALTSEQLDYFSGLYWYRSCVFWGTLPKAHEKYLRYSSFDELPLWVKECKSKAHQLNDKMFSDATLPFEQAFILFYDNNLPVLVRPDLAFNANNDAQQTLLRAFYRVATEGTELEKAVVKSFFYGREDKRDLKHLFPKKYNLNFSSSYSRFICVQTLGEQQHNLFEDYDFKELFKRDIFSFIRYTSNSLSFNDYRVIFRLPEADSKEEVLNALLDKDKQLELCLYESIIESYLVEAGTLEIFSPTVNRILATINMLSSDPTRKSMNVATWPNLKDTTFEQITIDVLLTQYALFDSFTVFPSREIKLQMGDLILRKIMALPDGEEQIRYYVLWLTNKDELIPITDIPLKNKIIDNLVAQYVVKYGKDDGSLMYYNEISPIMETLIKNTGRRDAKLLMSKWLTAIEAQKKLSDTIGIVVDPTDYKLIFSKSYKATRQSLVTLIKVADVFSESEAHKTSFLDYISSPLTQSNIDSMLQYIEKNIDVDNFSRALGWSIYDYDGARKDDKAKTDEKLSTMLMSLYYQFWDCSIYERSAIIEQVLIPASQSVSIELQTIAYEKGMAYISQKLFPQAADTSSEDYLALCIMKSYLHTADVYERSYLLTAMLVSANECMGQEISISKKLASVCEYMGPAYVKLVQAIHSHPNTTDAVRRDLAHIKGKANPPHRWSLWRHLSEVLSVEDFARIKRVGRLLGSASYNLALEVTLSDDSTVVLSLLREDAEKSANKGFTHIRATIDHCEHESVRSQRDMLVQTIDEAARLSKNEMNKEASDEQSRLAKTLYPHEMKLNIDDRLIQFSIKTASIIKSGVGYRFIDLMPGEEFNELPDTTDEERLIKRAVAKGVLTMELHNIFRGGQFDSDRHGNQLRVLVEFNADSELDIRVGLYDFGEMALESPTKEELYQLAEVMVRAPIDFYYNKSMDIIIAERITDAVQRGESTHYLMRLRKAFLAMHDFNRYLDKQDLVDILSEVASKEDIHPVLKWPLWRAATLQSGISYCKRSVSSISQWLEGMSLFSQQAIPESKEFQQADAQFKEVSVL